MWSQYVPIGSIGLAPDFGNLSVLALQVLSIPMIILGILLFAWGIYDWVQEGYRKESASTQSTQASAGKT